MQKRYWITCSMKQMLHISDQNQKNQDIRAVVQNNSLFSIVLSTNRNNNYPQFIKLRAVLRDDSETTNAFLTQSLVLSKDRTLNTDGKTTFNVMKDRIKVVNEKIDYSKNDHRLYWLNTIVGDIKNNIIGIYHASRKVDLPLFFKRAGIQIQS